jgi:hypothetical protein
VRKFYKQKNLENHWYNIKFLFFFRIVVFIYII